MASRVPLSSLPNGLILQPGSYQPASGATAYVYQHDPSSTLWGGANAPVQVTVFTTEAGATTFSQPLTADSNGELPGWVVGEQRVDISATYKGQTAGPALGDPVAASDVTGGGGGAVASVFGRTGSIAASSGDYTAAQITNAADKSSSSTQSFTGGVQAPDFAASGLTGATASSRYAGATISGHPVSGTFAKGDWVVDQSGDIWVCTTAGTPGTWAQTSGGSLSGGTTAGGALSPSYGRASTIAAPTLRDVVSMNDATWGAVGNGVANDTTAVNAAISALQAKGGGTLIFPPLNPAGNQALWTFQSAAVATTTNITFSGYGAEAQCVSATAGAAMFKGDGNSTSAGSYITSGFKLLGLTILGRGTEVVNQGVVQLDRATDCTIRDTFAQNWGVTGGGQVFGIINSQRFRILNNTCVNCSVTTGGQNVINIQIGSSFNGNTVLLQDGIIDGNVVQATSQAAVAISFGATANRQQLLFTILGNPTGGTTQLIWAWNGNTYTSATIGPNPTASDVQTALLAATSVVGAPPASSIVCYGGPAGGAAPYGSILAVFQSGATGLVTGLATNDAWTGGSTPQASWTYPSLRISIRNNDLESTAWTAIALEMGGNPAAVCPMYDVQITANMLRYTGPIVVNAFAITLGNDSTPLYDYAFLYRHILIAENVIHSNSIGIRVQGSDITLGHNEITAAYSGIQAQATNGSSSVNYLQHITIKGGAIRMSDSVTTAGSAIQFVGVQDSIIDTDIIWDTGTTADTEGVDVINGTRLDINVRVTNAPLRGIRLSGNIGEIRIGAGTRIVNPSSETSVSTSGIRIDGTLTDNIFIEASVSVRDNRGGSAKMTFAVDTSAATLGSFGVYLQGAQRFLGWTSSALNGTFAAKGDNAVWDTTGVRFTQGKRVTYVTAAPSTGTWGQGDLAWNQTPTSAGNAFWMCTTGGSPGTWTAMPFTSSGSSQTGLVRKSTSYTMSASDLGVIATVAAITITLPTNYTSANAAASVVVKNATSGSITVSTGSTGKIDNGAYTNAVNATSETISTGAQANVYIPDTNVNAANYDWIKS